jgi:hypothetical protein
LLNQSIENPIIGLKKYLGLFPGFYPLEKRGLGSYPPAIESLRNTAHTSEDKLTFVDRRGASAYIHEKYGPAIRYSANTLAKMAVTGGGPVFRRIGNRVVYEEDDIDDWITEKLGPPMRSTSEIA